MTDPEREEAPALARRFDFSTPEAQEALMGVSEIILEIRDEVDRTNRLYERTLGLAVVPMLLRRAAGRLWRKWKHSRRSVR